MPVVGNSPEATTYVPGGIATRTIFGGDLPSTATYSGGDTPLYRTVTNYLLNQDGTYILTETLDRIIISFTQIEIETGDGNGSATYIVGDVV